jgi:putative membrane protein
MIIQVSGLAIMAGVLLAGHAAMAAGADNSKKFLEDAIAGDIGEIRLGTLAEQKAQSEDARQFGRTLKSDHEKARKEAEAVAISLGVKPPSKPTEEAQKNYDELLKKSGEAFDSAFASMMVEDHQKDIAKFQAQADDQADAQLAQLAQKTLPALKKHLAMAKAIETKEGGKAGSN